MQSSTKQPIRVLPTGSALGADVLGVDLSRPLVPDHVSAIMDAWHQHLVLRFRGQRLEDADLVRFSRHFGDLDLAPITSSGEVEIPEYPEILVVSNVKVDGRPIGSLGSYEAEWHTDMSYVEEPPRMTCLYSLEIPDVGGNTGFLNMYAAYDALSDDMKRTIEGRRSKHDYSRNSAGEVRKGFEQFADETDPRVIPGAWHPLVTTHPETGLRALYLGRRRNGYVEGLEVAESEALLDALWAHAVRPEFSWEQCWQVGDLVMWDNRCTLHRRDAFDDDARRILHRTQVKGTARPS
jgi:taurine dioxygenase